MKIRWFTYFIMIYLLTAVSWWTLLLFNKNKQVFTTQIELATYQNEGHLDEIIREYQRQKIMILGEGIFLGASLLAGIWLINRANRRELDAINRQNNFLLAITHELKSPLSSIKLILGTIKNRQLNKAQSNELTVSAEEEVMRLEEMIENLLLSSSLDNDSHLILESLALDELLFGLLQELRKKFDHLDFVFINDQEQPVVVKGDRRFVSIALKNILENAQKYGDNSEIRIELFRYNGTALIRIADYGQGISQKEKKLIFDRFYRSGSEWTRASKGTGLGLYIAKKIIAGHSGNITVLDNKPKGTIFEISLPTDA